MLVALYVIIGYVPPYFVYVLGDFQLIVKIVSHPSSIQRRALWHRLPNNVTFLDISPLFLLSECYICLIALSRAIVFFLFFYFYFVIIPYRSFFCAESLVFTPGLECIIVYHSRVSRGLSWQCAMTSRYIMLVDGERVG